MQKNYYGYMRVSSIDQNEDRQRIELTRWGILEPNIYCDKQSGKDFDRPQYQKMKRKLKKGDVLVVKSIDRLGRNYKDIQEEWRIIVKEKGADIVIIDMPILDTRTNRDLIGTLISDIVLQLLSYVAETERINIRQRQAEGIAAAKLRGIHLGRYPTPIPDSFAEIYHLWQSKMISPKEAFQKSGLSENQFYWMVKKYRKTQNEPHTDSET
ncbi:MAG: recombinase family protein [Lachnospiraceae bacterium]